MRIQKLKGIVSLIMAAMLVLPLLPVSRAWADSGQLTLGQDKLGNIFMDDEEMSIPVHSSGDAVDWTVRDFWDHTVASGSTPVDGQGDAVIKPGTTQMGYFEMDLQAKSGDAVVATAHTTLARIRHTDVDAASSRFGVMTHFAQNWNTDIMPLIAKAGIKQIRDEHYWEVAEKTKGEYDFGAYDAYMQEAAANGIQVLGTMDFGNPLYDVDPTGTIQSWGIRRWVSDQSGTIAITGYFYLTQAQLAGSDGTGFRIFVDGREVLSEYKTDQESVVFNLQNVTVHEGSVVDIVATPGDVHAKNAWYDGVNAYVDIWRGDEDFNSNAQFGTEQGANQWHYGYANIPASRWDNYDPSTDFKEMEYINSQSNWKDPNFQWTTQTANFIGADIRSNDGGVAPYTDAGREGYANYGKAMLDYYTSLHAAIPAAEIWNEFNGSFATGPAAADKPFYYTELLKKSYETLKNAYPDVPVLGSASVMIPTGYLESIFKMGALDYMDAVAVHPYVQQWNVKWPELVWSEIGDLNGQIKRYNNGELKPIWATEFGSESTDRKYAAKFNLREMALLSSYSNVARSYVYRMMDANDFPTMGLVKSENAPEGKYAPNPAYVATSNLIHQLNGATPLGRETVSSLSNLYVMKFKDANDQELRLAWSADDEGDTAEFITDEPLTVVDMMGVETVIQPVEGKVEIPLGDSVVTVKGHVTSIQDTAKQPVADSFLSFSGEQGADNWQYGYYENNEFVPMRYTPEFTWNWQWQGGEDETLKVTQPGGYPSRETASKPAVRRWISTVDGHVKVEGTIGSAMLNYSIKVDGTTVFDRTLDQVEQVGYETTFPVKAGSAVDFVLQHPGEVNLNSDKTMYTARIFDISKPVTSIAVAGADDAAAITAQGGTLQMHAVVAPADADDKTVSWSVYNENGTSTDKATISAEGLLTALNNGTVKVVATALDGSGVIGSTLIAISGQQLNSGGSTTGTMVTPPAKTDTVLKVENGKAVAQLEAGQKEASFPAIALQQAGNVPVEVKSKDAAISIPQAVIRQLLGKVADLQNVNVKVVMDSASGADEAVTDPNLKIGDRVYQLDLFAVDKDGKEVRLGAFDEPVQLVLPYDASGPNKELLGVYVYDEAAKQWQYIGGQADGTSGTITAGVPHFSKYAVMAYDKSFADLPSTHWAYNAVKALAAKHIVTGKSDTEFQPAGMTTRAEFTAMLARLLELRPAVRSDEFSDVSKDAWYAESVNAAFEAGLVTGVTGTTFKPEEQITREQMAVLLVRAYEYMHGQKHADTASVKAFADDKEIAAWSADAVRKASAIGLLQGRDGNSFAPKATTSRAETAQAIYNFMRMS